MAHIERLPSDLRQQYETQEAENMKLKSVIKGMRKGARKTKLDRILEQENVKLDPRSDSITPGRMVPVINKVTAGYPKDFNDLDYPVGVADDYIRCPDLHDKNAFAVRVVGDSMQPKYSEGDIVVFSPAARVRNGDDCFVRFADPHETTFKRVFFEKGKKFRLQPRNEKYAPIVVEGKKLNGMYRAVIKYQRL
jgi:SOS-response transcriptional repressor LexA